MILTLLGYIPGIIYALCVLGCEAPPAEAREASGEVCGEATYVAVAGDGGFPVRSDLEGSGANFIKIN